MRLTDSADPLCIWQSVIDEDEFLLLKRQNSLVVSFDRFHDKLIDLFRRCAAIQQLRPEASPPTWVASLEFGGDYGGTRMPRPTPGSVAYLTISEATSLKQISHLTITMRPVDDQTLRRQFNNVLCQYKVGALLFCSFCRAPFAIPSCRAILP